MKKLFSLLLFFFCCASAFPQNYVTMKEKQLYDQSGNKLFVKGVNYMCDLYDDGTGMQVRPSLSYSPNFAYSGLTPPCTGQSQCYATIAADFDYIKNTLGCNTIRLCIANAQPLTCVASETSYTLNVNDNTSTGYHVYPTVGDSGLNFIIPFYSDILDIAANVPNGGVNVILLLFGRGGSCGGTPATIHDNYLVATAKACSTKTALLAYDEWNEPQWYEGSYPTKSQVCSLTKSWYNQLKTNDPNHLITVGLVASALETYRWSTDVYKADFYAFHIYADRNLAAHADTTTDPLHPFLRIDRNLDYDSIQSYKDRYNTIIKWIENTVDLPWIVGETGFASYSHATTTPGTPDYYLNNDGSLSGQAQFLTHAYTEVLKGGGMGTVWWQYKEVPWSIPGAPFENGFGLLTTSNVPKAAATALMNFNSDSVSGPSGPYPSDYQNLLHNTGTTISGQVVNVASSQGIKDAIIIGWHTPAGQHGLNSYGVHTITDVNGNFVFNSVMPPNIFNPNPSLTEINNLTIGAVGFNSANSLNQPASLLNSKPPFYLNKAADYYYDVTDVHLNLNAYHNDAAVTAVDNLSLQAFFVDFPTGYSGGSVPTHTFTAQGEIEILPSGTSDSYVVPFAEAAFYIGPVEVDCSDLVWSSANSERTGHSISSASPPVGGNLQQGAGLQDNLKTVYLSPESFLLRVYPNPASDKVLVQSTKSINFITLSNMYGASVAELSLEGATSREVDVSAFAPGTYLVKITYSDNSITYSQIIKQ